MRKETFNMILKNLAANYDTTPEEVYQEMQKVIDIGYQNPDPLIRLHWQNVPCVNGHPRPEDLIEYIASQL